MAGRGAMSMMGWGTSTWVLVKSNARPEEEHEVSHMAERGPMSMMGWGTSMWVLVKSNARPEEEEEEEVSVTGQAGRA